MNDAAKKPNAANRTAGTTIDARRKAQASNQPAYEPRPRPTYVYMPPADGRCRASSPIENAVNRTATSASTTARGVSPSAYVVANPIDRATATAGAMNVIDWNRTSVSPIALRCSPADCCAMGSLLRPAQIRSRSLLRAGRDAWYAAEGAGGRGFARVTAREPAYHRARC